MSRPVGPRINSAVATREVAGTSHEVDTKLRATASVGSNDSCRRRARVARVGAGFCPHEKPGQVETFRRYAC